MPADPGVNHPAPSEAENFAVDTAEPALPVTGSEDMMTDGAAELSEFTVAGELHAGLIQLDFLGAGADAVLVLRRARVMMLLRAVMAEAGLVWSRSWMTEAEWAQAKTLKPVSTMMLALTTNQWRALAACLGETGEHILVGLTKRERRDLAWALRIAETHLAAPLPHRAKAGLGQWWLWVLTTSVLLALVVGLLGWWVWRNEQQARANLARGRPVRVSSSLSREFEPPARLVDGIRTELGFHTKRENRPFAVIDLGAVKSFRRVVVYNRTDCCFARAVPLMVEVSEDDKEYLPLAERTEVFERWEAATPHAKGRYVRLRLDREDMLHLNEVEIY